MNKPRRILVSGRELAVYAMDIFPTECPHHGNTRLTHNLIGGIRLGCGCEWHVLADSGWYCTRQPKPATKKVDS